MKRNKKMFETTAIKVHNHAEQVYQKMSEEEVSSEAKKIRKESVIVFIVRIILSLFILSMGIYCFVNKVDGCFLVLFFDAILSIICAILSVKSCLKRVRKSDKELVKEGIEKKYIEENVFDGRIIKSAQIIDSYTEWSNKLHGFLNYNEIIQTRFCKFYVTYDDMSTEIYDIKENSKEYAFLMKHFKPNR